MVTTDELLRDVFVDERASARERELAARLEAATDALDEMRAGAAVLKNRVELLLDNTWQRIRDSAADAVENGSLRYLEDVVADDANMVLTTITSLIDDLLEEKA